MRVGVMLPPEAIEDIAGRAAEIVLAELRDSARHGSPWLSGWAAAADYLRLGVSTLKHDPNVPRHRVGGSVLFRTDELDAYAAAGFEGRTRFRAGSTGAKSHTSTELVGAHLPAK